MKGLQEGGGRESLEIGERGVIRRRRRSGKQEIEGEAGEGVEGGTRKGRENEESVESDITRKGRENEESVESDITRKRKLCACVKLE